MNMIKEIFLIGVIMTIALNSLSQCPGTHEDVCPFESKFLILQPPTVCYPSGMCDASLAKGFLIISVEDSVVLDAVDLVEGEISFGDYEGCIAVVPICYDLVAIQTFVDAMLTFNFLYPFCCTAMNDALMGLCDSVNARYDSASEIMGLDDLINVFGSDSIGAGSLQEALDSFNANVASIRGWCGPQIDSIYYCYDPVDFLTGDDIYEIDPYCPFPDCELDTIDVTAAYLANDPHQSIFIAKQGLNIEGDITSTEMIQLKAESEVILHPGFSTLNHATLEITMEPCVSPPPPELIDKSKSRE